MTSLTLLAFAMIAVFMALIMTKRVSALVALILVPLVFGLLGGFGRDLGGMMLDGITTLAPTGVMLTFAILYFSLMSDAGLFEPVIQRIVQVVGGDPLRIVVGTAFLALLVSLDGDGSTTYIITTTAMLPLYKRLGISRLVLASVVMQASGVMNLLPWGGPTARVASALKVDPREIFVPMIPAMVCSAIWVILVAGFLGRKERQRLQAEAERHRQRAPEHSAETLVREADASLQRPHRLWLNLLLTLGLLAALVVGLLPLPALFMIAFAIALLLNYPSLEEQKARLNAHAGDVLSVAALIFAAGIFTGILTGTHMVEAMARSVIALVPESGGRYLAVIAGLLSLPFTFLLSNDAFYFGVVPILSQAASHYGISAAEVGRASLVGLPVHLLSPVVPSTYLLVSLAGVDLADHQRFTLKWSAISSLLMLAVGIVIGVIPALR